MELCSLEARDQLQRYKLCGEFDILYRSSVNCTCYSCVALSIDAQLLLNRVVDTDYIRSTLDFLCTTSLAEAFYIKGQLCSRFSMYGNAYSDIYNDSYDMLCNRFFDIAFSLFKERLRSGDRYSIAYILSLYQEGYTELSSKDVENIQNNIDLNFTVNRMLYSLFLTRPVQKV